MKPVILDERTPNSEGLWVEIHVKGLEYLRFRHCDPSLGGDGIVIAVKRENAPALSASLYNAYMTVRDMLAER